MGELHLEIIIDRLLREHKLDLNIGKPQVSYREGVLNKIEVSGEAEHEVGGKINKGSVTLIFDIDSNAKDGIEFENLVKNRDIPREIANAIESTIVNHGPSGIDIGYPIVKTKVLVKNINYIEGETTELGMSIAIAQCFQKLRFTENVITYQPYMDVDLVVPAEFSGDVISDINSRKGKINKIESKEKKDLIKAELPLKKNVRLHY